MCLADTCRALVYLAIDGILKRAGFEANKAIWVRTPKRKRTNGIKACMHGEDGGSTRCLAG